MKHLKHPLLCILVFFGLMTFISSCQNNEKRRVKEVDINTVPKEPRRIVSDTVATPDSLAQYSIATKVKMDSLTTTFAELIELAQVDSILNAEGPYTVLAPVNEAWTQLPGGTIQHLRQPDSKSTLTNLIGNHIIRGVVQTNDLRTGSKLKTLQNEELNVILRDSLIIVEDGHGTASVIIRNNLPAKNGIIHTVNAVLMPQ